MSTTTTTTTTTSSSTSSSSFPKSSLRPIGAFSSHKPGLYPSVRLAEVQKHQGAGLSSWTIIQGHVYDITEFAKTHPGGQVIRLAAGRDSTCLIESYHTRASAPVIEKALLNKAVYVGPLHQDDYRPITNEDFFLVLQERVETHLKKIGYDLKTRPFEYVGIFEALLTLFVYALSTYYVSFHAQWWAVFVLAFCTARMGFFMHMGNHCAISRFPAVNEFIGKFMDVVGSNSLIWSHEHQVAHHMDPNDLDHDNDCQIGNPWIRMHPHLKWNKFQRIQHISLFLGISVGFWKWIIGDVEHFIRHRVGLCAMAVNKKDWAWMVLFKSAWVFVHLVIPTYYFGWKITLLQSAVFMAIGAHYLENIFIVNHIQSGLVPPPHAHWAEKQLLGTSNWGSGSLLYNWVSGGLNHQIEHHLFPAMTHYLYPYISPVVKQTCEEFNIPYLNYTTFSSAWIDMFTYIRDLGLENFHELPQYKLKQLEHAQQEGTHGLKKRS